MKIFRHYAFQKFKNIKPCLKIEYSHHSHNMIRILKSHCDFDTVMKRVKLIFKNFFQDDEPPEITYCVVENTGTLTLQAITPTQPMPSQEELDAKFAELVV